MRRYKNCFKIEGKRAFREADHIRVKWEKYREREWNKLMFQLWKQKVFWHRKYILKVTAFITANLLLDCLFIYGIYRWALWWR